MGRVTHPRPPISQWFAGWQARCTCGWESDYPTRPEATSAFLDHAETEHAVILKEIDK